MHTAEDQLSYGMLRYQRPGRAAQLRSSCREPVEQPRSSWHAQQAHEYGLCLCVCVCVCVDGLPRTEGHSFSHSRAQALVFLAMPMEHRWKGM